MTCNGSCKRIGIKRVSAFHSMYQMGFKRCQNCEIWITEKICIIGTTGKMKCPCCKLQVRHSPRNKNTMRIVIRL